MDCEDMVGCDTDCMDMINTNWDDTLESCTYAEER